VVLLLLNSKLMSESSQQNFKPANTSNLNHNPTLLHHSPF
jgi:hypothetical protein